MGLKYNYNKWYLLLLIPLVTGSIAWVGTQDGFGFLKTRIVVDKSERRLYLFQGFKKVKSYPVNLGKKPVGDKLIEGDKRTPTGRFYICLKKDKSKTGSWLGLSYPRIEDAERGLREGLINEYEYNSILFAHRMKSVPPWNTKLGGKLYIHGGGVKKKDWTKGCIAMRNGDVHELCGYVRLGTEILIRE